MEKALLVDLEVCVRVIVTNDYTEAELRAKVAQKVKQLIENDELGENIVKVTEDEVNPAPNNTIKIGSKVVYSGAWGSLPEKIVTIKGIEKCAEKNMKAGKPVEEINWDEKDYGVYDLSDGHWCYGYQIHSLASDKEDERPIDKIKKYLGHNGRVAFEHGFESPLLNFYNQAAWGGSPIAVTIVTYSSAEDEVFVDGYYGKHISLSSHFSDDEIEHLYQHLLRYEKYCKEEA